MLVHLVVLRSHVFKIDVRWNPSPVVGAKQLMRILAQPEPGPVFFNLILMSSNDISGEMVRARSLEPELRPVLEDFE